MTAKLSGKVKWFNEQKGYGFIDTGGRGDLFVHISDIQKAGYKTIKEGQHFFFDVYVQGQKSKAVNLEAV